MRTKFIWAYRLSPEEVKELFGKCQFFFDTNTLLHLFRIRKDVAKKAVKSISKYKDRISIPFHVAEEYHWHVVEILTDRIAKTQSLMAKFDEKKLFESLFPQTQIGYFPNEELEPYKDLVKKFCTDAREMLDKRLKECNKDFNSMEIANSLSKQLSDCILPAIPQHELEALVMEFKNRAADEIPPGYKDQHKEDSGKKRCGKTNEAGDYIIWEEILRWAAKAKKDVILVSNENKTDWIWDEHGFVIGPRWELRKEFHERTGGKLFHIIKLDEFLRLTADNYTGSELDVMTRPVRRMIIPDKKLVPFMEEIDELYSVPRFHYKWHPEIDMSEEMASAPPRKNFSGQKPKANFGKYMLADPDEYRPSLRKDILPQNDVDSPNFKDDFYL